MARHKREEDSLRAIPPELMGAYIYAREYYNSNGAEIRRHGHPQQSAHMKFGPSSTAPTPDDAKVHSVGVYLWTMIKAHEKRLLDLEFDYELTPYLRWQGLNVSEGRYNRDRVSILKGLRSYLG